VRKLALLALVLAIVCLVVTRSEHSPVVEGVGVALLVGSAVLHARSRRHRGRESRLRLTDEGVSVIGDSGTLSHVSWARLVEVVVLTTSAGPFAEDLFICLTDEAGGHCLVPHALASELLKRLLRLPGFDHQKFILAMGSTTEASFVCWSGRPGDGRAAAETPPEAAPSSG
jgi:hypothetical protein